MSNPIDLDYDDNYDNFKLNTSAITDSSQVHVTDLEEEESSRIQRTSSAAAEMLQLFSQLPFNDQLDESKLSEIPEVADRVTEAAQNTGLIQQSTDDLQPFIQSIKTHLALLEDDSSPALELTEFDEAIEANRARLEDESIPLPEFAELDAILGPDATVEDKRGFLLQINSLVADIMKLISKLNDRDRQKNDHLRKEYGMLNREIGDAISSKGTVNLWSSVGSLLVQVGGTLIGSAITSENFTKISTAIGQQIPGLTGSLFATGYDVTQSKSTNKLNLASTDMQSTSQKSGDNSGWKNELTQALNDVRQWMTAAARAN